MYHEPLAVGSRWKVCAKLRGAAARGGPCKARRASPRSAAAGAAREPTRCQQPRAGPAPQSPGPRSSGGSDAIGPATEWHCKRGRVCDSLERVCILVDDEEARHKAQDPVAQRRWMRVARRDLHARGGKKRRVGASAQTRCARGVSGSGEGWIRRRLDRMHRVALAALRPARRHPLYTPSRHTRPLPPSPPPSPYVGQC